MNLDELLKLNLQLFAEGDTPEASTESDEPEDDSEQFSEEQQKKINDLIAQAKSKEKSRMQKEFEKTVQERIDAALKKEKGYAELSEKEREKQKFEDERAEFLKEKAEFENESLKVQVGKDLLSKDLPSEFAEFLAIKGDSEQSLENVGNFKKAFDEAVKKAVKDSVRQPAVNDGGSGNKTTNLGQALAQGMEHSSGKIFE